MVNIPKVLFCLLSYFSIPEDLAFKRLRLENHVPTSFYLFRKHNY
jgi:hypothetical protein